MIQLSVIVVSYNTIDLLRDCLESIYGDVDMDEAEVLVVDNASSDGSPEMVAKEFPRVTLLVNPRNTGFAQANNQAIGMCSGEHILLLNSDARLRPGCSGRLRSRMLGNPQLGICGPAILNPDGSRQPSWGRLPTPLIELAFQSFLYKVLPVPYPLGRRVHPMLLPAYSRFRFVEWVSASAVLVHRAVIDRIGGLPEESFMYSEDVEFCHRAANAGFAIGYEPGGEAVHRGGGARAHLADWIENYTRGSILYFATHYPRPTVERVARLMVVGNGVRRALWQIVGEVSPSKRLEAEMRRQGYERAMEIARSHIAS